MWMTALIEILILYLRCCCILLSFAKSERTKVWTIREDNISYCPELKTTEWRQRMTTNSGQSHQSFEMATCEFFFVQSVPNFTVSDDVCGAVLIVYVAAEVL